MKVKDLKNFPKLKPNHGIINEGGDYCECEECYEVYVYNQTLKEIGELEIPEHDYTTAYNDGYSDGLYSKAKPKVSMER